MNDLYAENILDHNENPRNWGNLTKPTISTNEANPLCGDKIFMDLKFENDKLAKIAFNGQGCAISKAAASMLTEYVTGKTRNELEQITQKDVLEMIGIPLSMARVKCGLLGFYVLKKAITLLKIQQNA